MTCAACAARIEKTLNRVPGVEATVNFATETATARFDPTRVDSARMLAAVRHAGYHAIVRSDPERDRTRTESTQGRRLRRAQARIDVRDRADVAAAGADGTDAASRQLVRFVAHDELLPRWLQLLLATPVQLWIGRRFYVGAWHSLRGGGANMDVLIALGTSMAWGFSAVITLLGLHEQHVYFEAGATVITLVLLGKVLEARAMTGASAALESLLRLQPKSANVERNGVIVNLPIADVVPGDHVVVRAGESVAVDASCGQSIEHRRKHAHGREPPCSQNRGHRVRGHPEPGRHVTCEATVLAARRCWRESCASWPRCRVRRRQSSAWPTGSRRIRSDCRGHRRADVCVHVVAWGRRDRSIDQCGGSARDCMSCALGLATPAIMVGTGRGAQMAC
jgi:Cu+-exporting ATPase